MTTKIIVEWQSPLLLPDVAKGKMKTYWVAIEQQRADNQKHVIVFDAQYINIPLEFHNNDDSEDPVYEDTLTDESGDYIEAVGWFSNQDHADFANYYASLPLSNDYKLVGWAEYETPEWTRQ